MGPEELHILGAPALSIIDCGLGLVAFPTMLAGGAGVVIINVSGVGPAIAVVGFFFIGPGCGGTAFEGSAIASAIVAVVIVMRLPSLEVDGLLDNTRDLVSTVLPANVWTSTVMVLGGGASALAWADRSCDLVAVRSASCCYITAR